MKSLLALCIVAAAPFVWAQKNVPAPPSAARSLQGEVLEVKDVEIYTYLRLKTANGESWAAVPKAAVAKGARVSIENTTVMNNFTSKELKRTFPTVVFGTLAGAAGAAVTSAGAMPGAHMGMSSAKDAVDIKVPKASGANARTVAEVMTRSAALKDKPVLVRGKVVKYNQGIMGKNWIHLRDGSGSPADGSNDVLFTTTEQVKLGDVVTLKGLVRLDRDLGSGYVYKVIVEDATLQP